MKLYLSSYQIGDSTEALLELLGERRTAVVIANAADHFANDRRANWVQRNIETLTALGITASELDLKAYFGKPEELKKSLKPVGLIWVTGGNTFILRRAMKESGFDQLISELIQNEEIVYGGFSAGACVMSPSLKGIHLGDQPERVPVHYPNPEVIWDGLNLIQEYIVPHYRSEHPESEAMDEVARYYENDGLPHFKLRDGEALIFNQGKWTHTKRSGAPFG